MKDKLKEYLRVLRITQKPDTEEFMVGSKITGIGILVIGAIGFIVYLIATLLRA